MPRREKCRRGGEGAEEGARKEKKSSSIGRTRSITAAFDGKRGGGTFTRRHDPFSPIIRGISAPRTFLRRGGGFSAREKYPMRVLKPLALPRVRAAVSCSRVLESRRPAKNATLWKLPCRLYDAGVTSQTADDFRSLRSSRIPGFI